MAKPSLSLAVRSASFVNMLSRTMSSIGLFSRSLDDGQQEPCQYEVNPMSVSWMINKCTWPRRSNYVQFYIKVVDETIISWCRINHIFLIYRSPHWFGNLISEKRLNSRICWRMDDIIHRSNLDFTTRAWNRLISIEQRCELTCIRSFKRPVSLSSKSIYIGCGRKLQKSINNIR